MPRPIRYDREAVVDQAVEAFWRDGFEGCDVETLTRSAAVNRHSLYKAFGGKHGLFRDALRRYVERVAGAYVAVLEAGEGLDAIVAYFRMATGGHPRDEDDDDGDDDRRGCLIANTVVQLGRSHSEAAEIIDDYYARIEGAFAGVIARGQAAGAIRAGLDPQATARWLRLTSQGLSVARRFGPAPADLVQAIGAALAPEPDAIRKPREEP